MVLPKIVEEPTRLDNTLDLILTNRPNQINRIQVIPGISDHEAVFTEFNVKPARKKQVPRRVPLYKKAGWTGPRQHAEQLAKTIADAENTSSTDELWDIFKEGLREGIQLYIPHKTTKTRDSQPWIDLELKRKIRRRNRAFKASKKHGKLKDEVKFQKLKKEIQRDLRRSYWKYMEGIISPQENDTSYDGMKRFWTFVKHKKADYNGVAALRVGGKLINDAKEKATALNNQFQSVFTHETSFNVTPPVNKTPSMPNINITKAGIQKLLKDLKPGKAAGPDNISPRVLKELSDVVADPLTTIFRKSLSEGKVPQDWKHSNVTPIFKMGQKYNPANYRPISLTCIASKMMEHIMCSNIMSHASSHNILYNLQHGFRNQRSCETQLLEFAHDIVSNMQDGFQTDVCVLDFCKAFDKVGHQRLVEKLRWYGIDGEANSWIRDFLTNRTQSVVIDGVSSSSVPVVSGVPQGSVLGPCLFLFYINDIAENLTSTTRLFADDTMIYMAVKGEGDAKLLQQDLDTLSRWEDTWMMEFHPEKCEVINITRKRNINHHPYTLHGHQLKHVDQTKYLGVTITGDFRWNKHIDNISAKANNTLNFLRRNINVRDHSIKEKAYKALVRPILEYSSSVWDPHSDVLSARLEKIQRCAARFTLNNYRRTSSVGAMMQQLSWQTLAERRRASRLAMLYKMNNNLVAVDITKYLSSKNHTCPTRTENSQAFCIPHSERDYHKSFYFPKTARDWNQLPEDLVQAPSIEAFKEGVSRI